MSIKPITLWGHTTGPNPWKVAIILEELNVPYEHKMLQFSDIKSEPYESVNPNGRVPSIEDPNTGIKVFESGACIDYIVENYDKDNLLNPVDLQQKWAARSWRDFQMSGQGPYFGQVVYFTRYHNEDVPSVRTRFRNEVNRVIGVIDRHLAKTKTLYLTGDRIVYSDLMWVPWNVHLSFLLPEGTDIQKQFPNFYAWSERVTSRPSVQKIKKAKAEAEEGAKH